MSDSPKELREQAQRYRERGSLRMAAILERHAQEEEHLAQISAREVTKRIRVGRIPYRVRLNHNENGEWYANAHARSDVAPAAYVSGHPSCDDALKAIKDKLKTEDQK